MMRRILAPLPLLAGLLGGLFMLAACQKPEQPSAPAPVRPASTPASEAWLKITGTIPQLGERESLAPAR